MAVKLTPSMKATIANQLASAPRVRPFANSQNVVYKRRKPRKYRKKAQPSKSFQLAFHKLAPSKEIRFNLAENMDTATNVATRTAASYLDQIAQGSQLNQRLGSNVHISWLHLKGTFQSNSTTKTKAVRMMVLREVNFAGIDTTTYANLWRGIGHTSTYAPTGTSTDINWPVNKSLAYVLYDKVHFIRPEYDGITYFNKKVKINKVVRYTPNDSADSDPYHGRLLFLVCVADCDDTPSTTVVRLNCALRVFFKDYHKAR